MMTLDDFNNGDEAQRMWELYLADCYAKGEQPRPDSFTLWLEER